MSLAYIYTLLSVLLWGFSPIGVRYMVGDGDAALPAFAFTGLRYAFASVAFVPLLWQARHWPAREWLLGGLLGVVGLAGFNLPAAIGQQTVSAGLTGLLDGSEPLMIVIITAVLDRQMPRRWTIIGTLMALAGILLLATASGPALGDTKGICLVLCGAFLWSIYCVLSPPLTQRRGALPVTAVTIIAATLPMLAAGAPAMPTLIHHMNSFDWELTIAIGLGCSALSMFFWNAGSAGLGSEKASWFLYMIPVVSLVGGAILLHEPVKLAELAGGALILLSVYLAQK
jgi:drug/metabolite transporter (DMT)-like permease